MIVTINNLCNVHTMLTIDKSFGQSNGIKKINSLTGMYNRDDKKSYKF